MKQLLVRLAALSAGAILLTSAYYRIETSNVMVQAARHFLDSLTPEQRAKATFSFQDEERLNWHYIPRVRKGLPLLEMTPPQKQLAHALLATGLSQQGYIKAVSIMSLEDVLGMLEAAAPAPANGQRMERNPEKYYFSVFGEPSNTATWGFRVEGHHVSQNFTVVNGKVADTPSFFGANPAEVREGPRKGLRILAAEEDLARDLLESLTPEQKKIAIVDPTAYKDILTTASRKAALEGQPSGLSAAKMTHKQTELLAALVSDYAHNVPEQLAQVRMEQLKKAGTNLYFAWAGAVERGGPHYYRVQAPAFLIEYDNTQNGANHIHSVWRDYNGDFGLDLLAMHYQTSHDHATR
ncbi:MAG TPA: DUF3500 domain-containing protein [Bryobacteraceae bacterium]|nr:DUF3500 domain-containing protein [Bryobacteraceae bacterium]